MRPKRSWLAQGDSVGVKEQPVTRVMKYGKVRRYTCRRCGRPFRDYYLPEGKRVCPRCVAEREDITWPGH